MDPSLWDDSAYPISIYSLNEYLKADAANIIISLNRIASFVRNRFLDRKKEKDIAEFGYATWNLILSIYKSGWDSLTANDNNRTFHQCVLAQFRPRNPKNDLSYKK